MPSVAHHLQNRIQNPSSGDSADVAGDDSFGVTSRTKEESAVAANPSFTDRIVTKDIHIEPLTSLSVRIFIPENCLVSMDVDLRRGVVDKVRGLSENGNKKGDLD
ncbi:hypothetical protein LIER_36307 [Lithospermum erythrorhizon]|uniref:Uncharacterized protein n=1 Tax=Lithospermum erythrorhizon TaxID=34254 RepID=A0AAV3P8P9_LITER